MAVELRDYQHQMLSQFVRAWKKHRSVMVQMPTGTGKTHLMAAAIRDCLCQESEASQEVLVVAHRRELLDQIQADTVRLRIA